MPFQGGNNYGAANFRVSDKENRERVRKWWDKLLGGLPQKCRIAHCLLCTPLAAPAGLLEPTPQNDRRRVHWTEE